MVSATSKAAADGNSELAPSGPGDDSLSAMTRKSSSLTYTVGSTRGTPSGRGSGIGQNLATRSVLDRRTTQACRRWPATARIDCCEAKELRSLTGPMMATLTPAAESAQKVLPRTMGASGTLIHLIAICRDLTR